MAKSSKNGESKMVFVSPTPHKQWKVKSADSKRIDSIHDKKADAVNRARELSQNRRGEMVIQHVHGEMVKKGSGVQRRGASIRPAPVSMPKLKIGVIRERLGVSQAGFSRIVGYSIRTIANWEAGEEISAAARQKLAETARLTDALEEIVGADELGEWLESPNPAFEGQTPTQLIERGESDRLWKMIFMLNAGVAS